MTPIFIPLLPQRTGPPLIFQGTGQLGSWVYKLERAGFLSCARPAGPITRSWISWDKLELRCRPEIARGNFANVTLFGSWVPGIATTDFWLAHGRWIPDEIGNTRIRRKPIFRRRDFSEQIPGSPKKFLKKFFQTLDSYQNFMYNKYVRKER